MSHLTIPVAAYVAPDNEDGDKQVPDVQVNVSVFSKSSKDDQEEDFEPIHLSSPELGKDLEEKNLELE